MKKKVVVLVLFFAFFPLLIACNGIRLQQTDLAIPTPISAIQQPVTESSQPTNEPEVDSTEPVTELNIEPTFTPPPVEGTSPPAPVSELDPFVDALETAVSNHNYQTMTSYMSEAFIIGHYGSEGLALTPTEAHSQLQTNYAPPATQIQFPNADHATITDMMGLDPLTAFGPDANLIKAVYSQGWGQSGTGDAILVIAERPDGAHFWYGVIYAHSSFVSHQPDPNLPSRISFEPGATSAIVNGLITEPGGDEYLLRALEGQFMTIKIESPNNDVRLSLYGLDDGQPLSRANNGATYWRGVLQATQDYSIRAVYNGAGSNYKLTVDVQPIPEPQGAMIVPLQFASGETGTAVTGKLAQAIGAPHRYQLNARAGQFMSVSVRQISSTAKPVITVLGKSWGPISPDGLAHEQQSWVGQLPKDDTYELVVNALNANTDYVLDVQIIDGPFHAIQYPSGKTESIIDGFVEPFKPVVYAIEANAGQEMDIDLMSLTNTAQVTVEITDRSLYLGLYGYEYGRRWSSVVPVSGPYYIFVTSTVPQPYSLYTSIITPTSPPAPEYCPSPETGQMRLSSDYYGYCFLYPAGLQVEPLARIGGSNGVELFSPPSNAGLEPSAIRFSIDTTGPANGRSLEELAQELVSQSGGSGSFSNLSVGGQPAILIESQNTPVIIKTIVLIHDDLVYHFIISPIGYMTPITFPSADELLDMVVDSFVFFE